MQQCSLYNSLLRRPTFLLFLLLSFTLSASGNNTDDTVRINLLNKTTRDLIQKSNYPDAIKFAEQAEALSGKLLTNNPPKEIEMAVKKGLASTLNYISIIYRNQGDYPKALTYAFKALKIKEEIGDKNGIGASYNNIGTIYNYQEDYNKALDYALKALKISEESGDKNRIAASCGTIGNIYEKKGDYTRALQYDLKSLKISEANGSKNRNALGNNYGNIGSVYEKLGNYPEALRYNLQSLKMLEEIKDERGIAAAYANLGSIYFKQGDYTRALAYENDGLSISKEIGVLYLVKDIQQKLADIYIKTNRPAQAFEHYKEYIITKDSLFNQEKTKKILLAEMKLEQEKKKAIENAEQEKKERILEQERSEKKIAYFSLLFVILLSTGAVAFFIQKLKTNRIRSEKNKFELELKWFNAELKALRSQMNPHFIFNCMNAIQSFMTQNDARSASRYLSKFARLIRLTLENSLHTFIPLEAELKTLEDYMELEKLRFDSPFNYTISVDENIDPETITVPSMLLQPYIENAIIHGIAPRQDQKGEINISFKLSTNNLQCEIKDNGIGRKKANEKKEKMGIAHKSIAMSITQERLELINIRKNTDVHLRITDLEDEDHTPKGTRVELTIPLQ